MLFARILGEDNRAALNDLRAALAQLPEWSAAEIKSAVKECGEAGGVEVSALGDADAGAFDRRVGVAGHRANGGGAGARGNIGADARVRKRLIAFVIFSASLALDSGAAAESESVLPPAVAAFD